MQFRHRRLEVIQRCFDFFIINLVIMMLCKLLVYVGREAVIDRVAKHRKLIGHEITRPASQQPVWRSKSVSRWHRHV